MNHKIFYAVGLLSALAVTPALAGEQLFVYPAAEQSDTELADDRFACHQWAVAESGFDPSSLDDEAPPKVVRVPVPENSKRGATAKGAAVGAIAGGVIGATDDEVGKGAAIGAVLGTVVGATIEQEGQREAEAQAGEEAEALAESKSQRALRRSNYRRAISACLEGKGYVVR